MGDRTSPVHGRILRSRQRERYAAIDVHLHPSASAGTPISWPEPMNRAAATVRAWTAGSTSRPGRLGIPLALLALYVIWGSTYLAIRDAVATIPPFYMGGIRFLIAGSVLYALLRLRGVPNPAPHQWRGSVIVGVLLLTLGNGMVGLGERSVASGLAAVLIGSVPIWAALFAGIWGNWPGRLEIGGLVIGFAGIIVLNTGSGLRGTPAAGLLILAAASWALGSVWSRFLPLPSGLMASATEMLVGGVGMVGFGIVTRERLVGPSPGSVWAMVYLIVFGSFVAFSAYNYLLHRVRPLLATSYAYVNPVVAVALGAALAGEAITPAEMVALGLILLAVALVVAGRGRA